MFSIFFLVSSNFTKKRKIYKHIWTYFIYISMYVIYVYICSYIYIHIFLYKKVFTGNIFNARDFAILYKQILYYCIHITTHILNNHILGSTTFDHDSIDQQPMPRPFHCSSVVSGW